MTDQKSESTNEKFPPGTLFFSTHTGLSFVVVSWKETGNPNEPYVAKLLLPSGETNTVRASTLENHLRNHWPNIKIISPEGIEQ